jgi:hypothetical protein
MSHKFVDWGNATLSGLAELQVSIVPFKVGPFGVNTLGLECLSPIAGIISGTPLHDAI